MLQKMRNVLIALGMLMSPLAASGAQVSIAVGTPHVSIGINVPSYPQLVRVPGHPVYYAPRLSANFFFYDGLYWVFHGDNWYASSWYNGPWWFVEPYAVPVYILRIPVRYYRKPPSYFRSWHPGAPPRWDDHWGRDWEHDRSGWDREDRRAVPAPAPLPFYQRKYSRDQYPWQTERQRELHQERYRYEPRDPVVQRQYQERYEKRDEGQQRGRGGDQRQDQRQDRDQQRR